jgi:GntR family transcriptional repressor for pyruvate dehydrogenase complex
MQVNPISTKRTYQYIVEQIIQLIKDEQISPGHKLPPERALAEMFKVSRASIREAFRAMEIIGLIEVRPGEGTFVTNLNIAPFINTIAPLLIKNDSMEDDLLEFRRVIEIEAVKLTAKKITKEKLKLLKKPIDYMEEAIDENDTDKGADADIAFHKAIFAVSDNFILIKAAECISYILEMSVKFNRKVILKSVNNSKELLNQHLSIYSAIEKKDSTLAGQLMERHLNFVKEIY